MVCPRDRNSKQRSRVYKAKHKHHLEIDSERERLTFERIIASLGKTRIIMEVSLEIDPEKTLFVLGPGFAASLLGESATRGVPPLSYTSLRKALKETGLSPGSRRSRGNRASDDMDVQQTPKRRLDEVFAVPQLQRTELAERLLSLHQEGALLAYLHPDSLCEEAMGLTAFTTSQAESWKRNRAGLLHPFGVHTAPDSIQMPSSRKASEPLSVHEDLTQVLRERSCICIGLYPSGKEDTETSNPLVERFLDLIHTHSESLPTILHDYSSSVPSQSLLTTSATLRIHNVLLPQGLCHISETSKAVGHSINFPPQVEGTVSVSLVLGNKSGLSRVTEIVSSSTGVNFIISNNLQCMGLEFHPLSVRVAKKDFNQFWEGLASLKTMSELVENSVLFIALRNGSIMWLNSTGSSKNYYNREILGRTVEDVVKSADHHQPSKTPSKQPIPRWVAVKQKVSTGLSASKDPLSLLKDDGTPVLSSILKSGKDGRRKSLPLPSALPPSQTLKAKPSPSSNPITVSSRQQLLISKYLFTRKHKETDPAANSSLLRQLLSGEPKVFPKPDKSKGSTTEMLENWTLQRRKNLFLKENSDWSSSIDKALKRKLVKWEKARAKRKQRIAEQQEIKTPSVSSANSEDLRQQLTSPLTYSPLQQSHTHSPSLLSPINPFMFPTATAGALSLHTPPLVYPTSYLSSYPFLTTALPFVQTTVLPQLTQHSTNLFGGIAVPATTTAPVVPRNGQNMTQAFYSSPYCGPVMADSSSQTPLSIGHKRSSSSQRLASSNSSISSLLKQEPGSPPLTKRQRLNTVSPSSSYMDDRSDGEEERIPTPSTSSSRDGELWQFLLDLLLSNIHSDWIQWNPQVTMEFTIKRPKDVARLWNTYIRSESNTKDSSNFKRALSFCLQKSPPILFRVEGKPHAYRFSQSVLYYINMRYTQQIEGEFIAKNLDADKNSEMSRSREVLVVD